MILVIRFKRHTNPNIVECTNNVGIYKDKPYTVNLTIGNMYKIYKTDSIGHTVMADDGRVRRYMHSYFVPSRANNERLKEFI